MHVVYFADDGTRFEDEDECEQYELKQKLTAAITESFFFNENGKYMTTEEWLADPECCDYMVVADNEEAELIYKYLRETIGLCHPWENWRVDKPTAGRYYYSHNDDRWHNFDEEHGELLRIMKIFED